MANMSKFKAETALDTGQFELTVAAIIYRNYIRGQLNKPREEPLTTESQPTRTPTTTGRKHVAGAKSAGSRKTTPQDPATPATQSATLPAADGKESLAFLRNQTVFEIMRTAVQKQPAWLLGFLHQMERSNSTLLLMISQNQQQFFSMLNEIGGESEGTECGTSEGRLSREGVIHVTQEENEVINKINQAHDKILAELKQTREVIFTKRMRDTEHAILEIQASVRIQEKPREEPHPTASQPTRTPTTTGGKHVAGAKSAGSGETTQQAPARPATQSATLSAAGEETSLAFLRNQPVFESMRTEVSKHPTLLLEFLLRMERSNPTLLEMISRNPQQFMSMLNETGGESGEGGGGAPEGRSSGEGVIHVTQGEKEFIDRTKQQQAKMEEQEEGIPMNQIQAMLKDLKDQIRASLEQRREKLRTELIRLEHTRETISMRLVEEIQLEQEEEERRKNVFKELEAKLAHTGETISIRLVEEIQQLEQEEEERRKILLKKLEATVARRGRRNESRGFIQSLFGFVRGSA